MAALPAAGGFAPEEAGREAASGAEGLGRAGIATSGAAGRLPGRGDAGTGHGGHLRAGRLRDY
jgi:hypothetical protein